MAMQQEPNGDLMVKSMSVNEWFMVVNSGL